MSKASIYAECYVCDRPMDGFSESDCHCFHRKEFSTAEGQRMSEQQLQALMALVDKYGEECARVEYASQCDELGLHRFERAKYDAREAVQSALAALSEET